MGKASSSSFRAGRPSLGANDADEPAHFLAIYSPAGFESYFDDIAAVVEGGGPNPSGGTALTAEILAPL